MSETAHVGGDRVFHPGQLVDARGFPINHVYAVVDDAGRPVSDLYLSRQRAESAKPFFSARYKIDCVEIEVRVK